MSSPFKTSIRSLLTEDLNSKNRNFELKSWVLYKKVIKETFLSSMCELVASWRASATVTSGAAIGIASTGIPGCPASGGAAGHGAGGGSGGGAEEGAGAVPVDGKDDAPRGCDPARPGRVVGRGQGSLKQQKFHLAMHTYGF